MLYKNALDVLWVDNDGRLYVKENKTPNISGEGNDIFLNKRREGIYGSSSLSYMKTKNGKEYLVPRDTWGDYVNSMNVVAIPDQSWELSNWVLTTVRDSSDLVGAEYVLSEKFTLMSDDRQIVRLAKRVLNDMMPLTFGVSGKSDRRRLGERMNEVNNNTLSSKQFFKIMHILGKKVDIVVSDKKDGDGISETVI